jgi:hypothetical protein
MLARESRRLIGLWKSSARGCNCADRRIGVADDGVAAERLIASERWPAATLRLMALICLTAQNGRIKTFATTCLISADRLITLNNH